MVHQQVFRLAALGALVIGAAATACSASAPTSQPVSTTITNGTNGLNGASAPPPGSHKVAQFTATVDHSANTFTIKPVGAPIQLGQDLKPQSVDNLNNESYVLPDGGGSPSASTIDLVTTAVDDLYPGTKEFDATVELRNFYDRAIANVYVQITSVTYNGVSVPTGYNGKNSAATNPLGLSNTYGLWEYDNGSTNGQFLSANPTLDTGKGKWAASVKWKLDNAADENIVYTIEVWASLSYSSYTQGFANVSGYTAICPAAGGSGKAKSITEAKNVALPFDFTLYSTNFSAVNIERNGQFTPYLSSTSVAPDASGVSLALPSASAPNPVFCAFWDSLAESTTDSTADICTETIGTAPNRMFAIEWYNFDFNSAPDGPNKGAALDFEAFLYEGTGEIDTVYNSMVGPTSGTGVGDGREQGDQATVGMQGQPSQSSTTLASTSDHDNSQGYGYGTGQAWAYTPNP